MSTETPIDELAVWVAAYREANRNAAEWADTAVRAKEHITELLEQRDADVGTVGGKPAVKWTPVTTQRLNTKAFKEDHPELAAAYTSEQTTKRFKVLDD